MLTLNGILSHTKLRTPTIDNTNPITVSRIQRAWHLRRRCVGGFWPAKGPTWTRRGFRANIAVVVVVKGEDGVEGVGGLFSTSNSCSMASRSLYLMRKNDATKEMKAAKTCTNRAPVKLAFATFTTVEALALSSGMTMLSSCASVAAKNVVITVINDNLSFHDCTKSLIA